MPVLCVPPCFPSSQEFGCALMSDESRRNLTEHDRISVRLSLETEISKSLNVPDLSAQVKRYEEAVYRAAATPEAYFDLLEQMLDPFVQRLTETYGFSQTLQDPGYALQLSPEQMSTAQLLQQLADTNAAQLSSANHYGALLSSGASLWQTPQPDLGPSTVGRLAALHTTGSSSSLDHLLTSASPALLSRSSAVLSTTQPALSTHLMQQAPASLSTRAGVSNRVLQPLQPGMPAQPRVQISSQVYLPSCVPGAGRPKSAESLVLRPGSAFSSGELPPMTGMHSSDLASELGDAAVSESGSGVENLPVEWQVAREQLLQYQLAGGDDDDEPRGPPQLPRPAAAAQPSPYPRYSLQSMPVSMGRQEPQYLGVQQQPQQQLLAGRVQPTAAGWPHMGAQYHVPAAGMEAGLPAVQGGMRGMRLSSGDPFMLMQAGTQQQQQQLLALQLDQAGVAAVRPPSGHGANW